MNSIDKTVDKPFCAGKWWFSTGRFLSRMHYPPKTISVEKVVTVSETHEGSLFCQELEMGEGFKQWKGYWSKLC